MRIAILAASGPSGIECLIDDQHRGELYELACVAGCDTSIHDAGTIATAAIPSILRPIKRRASFRNLHDRQQYDRETVDLLQSFGAEYVFAVGYPYVLTEPMLEAFPERIIAVHDGDLTRRDELGQRRWVGMHAVLEAIVAGEKATRNSMYIVTRDVGHGPLLLVGKRHEVPELVNDALAAGDYDRVAAYARLHRAWMRREWGTLLRRGIEFLAAGTLQIIRGVVWIDGVPGPCRLGEAPDACEELAGRTRRGIPASCPLIRQ